MWPHRETLTSAFGALTAWGPALVTKGPGRRGVGTGEPGVCAERRGLLPPPSAELAKHAGAPSGLLSDVLGVCPGGDENLVQTLHSRAKRSCSFAQLLAPSPTAQLLPTPLTSAMLSALHVHTHVRKSTHSFTWGSLHSQGVFSTVTSCPRMQERWGCGGQWQEGPHATSTHAPP